MPLDPMTAPTSLDRARAARPARGSAVEPGTFAQVLDLADARRRRMTGPGLIPEEVWDAMHRAAELADDLADNGERVHFDTHRLTGRVVASLTDGDGELVRRLALSDVVAVGADPDHRPAA